MDEVFHRFGIRVSIKLNNRKILSGIAEIIGETQKIVDITVAIDKLDKIGLEKVNEELRLKGIPDHPTKREQPRKISYLKKDIEEFGNRNKRYQ